MITRIGVGLAVALVFLACATSAAAGGGSAKLETVEVAGSPYWTGDPLALASRIIKTPSTRIVLAAIRKCRGAGAHAFISKQRAEAGVVAWVPLSISGCFGLGDVRGGGPSFDPCLQAYRTPLDQDPANVSGRASQPRSFVLIAGTNRRICADLSTQVPGGVWARTMQATPGLPRGSVLLVKCQEQTAQGLADYLAPYSARLPASKPAYWLYDQFVLTNGNRLAGVPSCSGIDF